MMKLIDFYKAILNIAGLTATQDGFVSNAIADKAVPAMIKGKRLVLPIDEHLMNPKPDEQMMFHPLMENTLREESVVLEAYRGGINSRLHFIVATVAHELLIVASSTAEHAKLSPAQAEVLSKLKHADDKTLEVFQKLLTKMPADQSKDVFVKIYLKRGGSIGKKKYQRVGIVSFPFYDELKKDGDVYGVKLRVKDREVFVNLMEYIFPEIDIAETYHRGSSSAVAPYLDALLKAVIAVATPINDQVTLFKNIMDDSDKLLIQDDWVDAFNNLDTLLLEARMIPMQAGNDGSGLKVIPPQPAPMQHTPLPAALMGVQQQQPFVQQPYGVNVQTGIPKNPDGSINMFDVIQRIPAVAGAGVPQGFPAMSQRMERTPGWAGTGYNQPVYPNQVFPNLGLPNQGFPNQGFPNQNPAFGGGFQNPQFPQHGYMPGYMPGSL